MQFSFVILFSKKINKYIIQLQNYGQDDIQKLIGISYKSKET